MERDAVIANAYDMGIATMPELADRYGISRERVRQILVKEGVEDRWQWHTHKMRRVRKLAPNNSPQEISDTLGVSVRYVSDYTSDIRKPISGDENPVAIGRKGEDWFIEKCQGLGFDVEPQLVHAPFDVLVNGHRVDVKFTTRERTSPSRKNVNPVWGWQIAKTDADFYACIIGPTQDVFIVPPLALPGGMGTRGSHFVITWPTDYHGGSKYAPYHNAWHLLERAR